MHGTRATSPMQFSSDWSCGPRQWLFVFCCNSCCSHAFYSQYLTKHCWSPQYWTLSYLNIYLQTVKNIFINSIVFIIAVVFFLLRTFKIITIIIVVFVFLFRIFKIITIIIVVVVFLFRIFKIITIINVVVVFLFRIFNIITIILPSSSLLLFSSSGSLTLLSSSSLFLFSSSGSLKSLSSSTSLFSLFLLQHL